MSAVTNQSIDNRIDTVTYHRLPDTTITFCAIKMVNGFIVIGQSACINPADFDAGLGESLAHDDAREKLWPLEGYLAAERRYQDDIKPAEFDDVEQFANIAVNLDYLKNRLSADPRAQIEAIVGELHTIAESLHAGLYSPAAVAVQEAA